MFDRVNYGSYESIENDNRLLKTNSKLDKMKTIVKEKVEKSFSLHHSLKMILLLVVYLLFFIVVEQAQFAISLRDCKWPQKFNSEETYDRVLILSDVHVLGRTESPWPLLHDNDHYLGNFFGFILEKYQPNTIIILGDLVHEGYYTTTTDEQFNENAERFKSEMSKQFKNRNVILLMGNHDAGDYLTPESTKVQRWESQFGSSFYQKTIAGVNYQAINSITVESVWNQAKALTMAPNSICLSHYPMFLIQPKELQSYFRQNCRYIFTGHEHFHNDFGNETMLPAFSPNRIEGEAGFILAYISPNDLSFRLCYAPNRNNFHFFVSVIWLSFLYRIVAIPLKSKHYKRLLISLLLILIIAYAVSYIYNLGQVLIPLNYFIVSTAWIAGWNMNKYITIIFCTANFLSIVFSAGMIQTFTFSRSTNQQ